MLQGLSITKQENDGAYCGSFFAMASSCEVLVECSEALCATQIIEAVFTEAKRIESKFSRYLKTNIVYKINHSAGKPVCLDDETCHLVDFAYLCHQLSDGLFDITSGVLAQVWSFDGSDNIPDRAQIDKLLPLIGLHKVTWQAPYLTLPKGMALDFGGIGKEYAVDCCLAKAVDIAATVPVLLNFGGDLICNGSRQNGSGWTIGIESVVGVKPIVLSLKKGALATSGDVNRYLLQKGIRYSHILNPLTGYSVIDAPRSITVAAESCIEAGLLSTLAMLQGAQADPFLAQQSVDFWIQK
ncbi:MAG: thiamine biosynthesis lipoprotein [Psychromonas sp.]|jgi:thiamine biosynthesis lipoprotein|uniref:FAD:protein FMN transferase n=1 Tax=Psychromonas sp. TaxID=1884585 RepID=UPI0039E5606D